MDGAQLNEELQPPLGRTSRPGSPDNVFGPAGGGLTDGVLTPLAPDPGGDLPCGSVRRTHSLTTFAPSAARQLQAGVSVLDLERAHAPWEQVSPNGLTSY